MSPIALTLPVPPSANRWWRNVDGRMLISAEARRYIAATTVRCQVARVVMIRPPRRVRVELVWYRAKRQGDLDKRVGIALDALQGTVYENDSQVVELSATRREDRAHPRLEVTVTDLGLDEERL